MSASAYIKIASQLRELIRKGLLPVNSVLSERKLAAEYGTSRATAAAALKILKEEGFAESVPKSGTRVSAASAGFAGIWEKLVAGGMSVAGTSNYKSTNRYLTSSGKKGVTFGLHEEFDPYGPLRKAFKSLAGKKDISGYLNTFDDKGLPMLRAAIAKHLEGCGIKTGPDNIIVFHGYLEAVYTVSAALLNRGVNLYYAAGDMISGMGTMKSTGVNMCEIASDKEGPSAAGFERVIKPGRNLFYANPVNSFPSGVTYTESRMKALMKICVDYNVPVLENDFLRDLWINPPPAPFKARKSDSVIYIGSMANSYVTGIRTAWAVVPDYAVPRICEVKMQMNSGSSGAELIVNEILAEGYYYEFLDNIRRKLPERIEKTDAVFNKYLRGYASWNPENIIYTARLEFDGNIDTDRLILENPYFIMKDALIKDKKALYTNVLGMSMEDIEELAISLGRSVKSQMK